MNIRGGTSILTQSLLCSAPRWCPRINLGVAFSQPTWGSDFGVVVAKLVLTLS